MSEVPLYCMSMFTKSSQRIVYAEFIEVNYLGAARGGQFGIERSLSPETTKRHEVANGCAAVAEISPLSGL